MFLCIYIQIYIYNTTFSTSCYILDIIIIVFYLHTVIRFIYLKLLVINYYILCIVDVEKVLIDKLFENATKVLTDEDRKLPAVLNIVPLIRRGIGIHHGGIYFIL